VNYFHVGNARRAFGKVRYSVELKVRRFAMRQRKRSGFGGSGGTTLSCTGHGVCFQTTGSTRRRGCAHHTNGLITLHGMTPPR
jgi:hypothetical protein